MIQFKQIFR